ncbi:hypothetical protein [Niallia sp. MER 6]|uniref:hypothetical protein n=1 Tax=Niallia sp. MER 6 TaxID=2939567 RepID=UPI00203D2DB2|nr:hypothetical protein [Niallia sp. MER 6]MCM3030347.1 hypothetical protein [Niallia sp. MER 6]
MSVKNLNTLQQELRDCLRVLKEDIDDIQPGDEYNPDIYKETIHEISFIEKTLNRIWELKHSN